MEQQRYNENQFNPNKIEAENVELYSKTGKLLGIYPKSDIALMLRDRVAVLVTTGAAKYLID